MKTIWAFIKWALRYEPRYWASIAGFLKLWIAVAVVLAVVWFGTLPFR